MPIHQGSYDNGSIVHHPLDDDSDSDQEQPQAAKKGGSAFDVVRNKLIRTMSHDSSTKNPSLTSLGNSDEEIARRAELRRLMRQRIQDELQTEQPDDDMENKPTHGIRCIASIVNLGLPNAGPRDAIEFAVNKSPLDARVPRSGKDQSHETEVPEPQNITDNQNKMSLDRNNTTEEDKKAEKDGDKRDGTGFVTNLPSQAPRFGQVEQAHSQKSFQLSNSATRLDRILGPDNSFNSRHASSSGDGHSALGVWLIAQGLRSRDNSTLHFDDDEEEEKTASGINNAHDVNQPGPAETTKKAPTSDSQKILSKEDKLPANETSAANGPLGKAEPSGSFNSEGCKIYSHPEISPRRTGNTSSPLSEGRNGAPTVATTRNSLADNSSSCYPSKFQPSPARSRQNLYSLDLKELEGQTKSSQDQESAEKQQQNSTNDDKPRSKEIDIGHGCQGQTPTPGAPDITSPSQSECASFLQREAELGTIERRFGDLLTRKKSKRQYTSRFREEFNRPSIEQPVRKSFMSKIHLTVPIRKCTRPLTRAKSYAWSSRHDDRPQKRSQR
ncbi:hypothetical protein N0V84_005844 [Fusarium piperis]|uniref:Uncharacterized protein n=1 Tax=Fusarium piperis TaxID=1435070 RepID=A0A9W8WD08_9HYPO|nr:hypothetical protein N0V84_005844 [Fusarium piperis]